MQPVSYTHLDVYKRQAQDYLKAMYAAANYAWANRQMMTHWIRETCEDILGKSAKDMEMDIVYDVAHNIAKQETHKFKGNDIKLVVHLSLIHIFHEH